MLQILHFLEIHYINFICCVTSVLDLCNEWPHSLDLSSLPLRITTRNYLFAGPSLYHPGSRKVKLQVPNNSNDNNDNINNSDNNVKIKTNNFISTIKEPIYIYLQRLKYLQEVRTIKFTNKIYVAIFIYKIQ